MLSHAMVGTNDLSASVRFYDATLGVLGITKVLENDTRAFYRDTANPGAPAFGVVKPINGAEACHANGGTLGFRAKDEAAVDAWYAAGLANGGTDEGAPGIRPMINRYGAYLRDPEGNKLCAFVAPSETA
jgi:catechol 2,3-dioxygenase-like lactoylglutathione lyase family enzyme